jgi:serine/threonine protein kinase/tetratricopeptide (TPR) repeat protein
MPDLTGLKLGQYELLQRLGRGGMAEVYRAYQAKLDRFVAIKVMLPHVADEEGFTERFEREAKSVASLRHANIVQVFDFGDENGQYYMVMEFLQGDTLKKRLKDTGAFPIAEALETTAKLADALSYAHRQGMIHRDIKPANVLYTKDAEPVLTDFGVAKIMGATQMTSTGALIGTPTYISPEAARGDQIDARSDVYSLGVLFYECLTGRVPYDADTPMAILYKHISEPLPSVIGLPPSVELTMRRSLTKEAQDRYQTAEEFRDALMNVRAEMGNMSTGTFMTRSNGVSVVPNSTPLPKNNTKSMPGAKSAEFDGATLPLNPSTASLSHNNVGRRVLSIATLGVLLVIGGLVIRQNVLDRGAADPTVGANAGTTTGVPFAGAASNTPTLIVSGTPVGSSINATQSLAPALGGALASQTPLNTPTETLTATPTETPTATFTETFTATPTFVLPTETPTVTPTPVVIAGVELLPNFVDYQPQIAEALDKMRNYQADSALEIIDAALANDPNNYDLRAARATILTRYRDMPERLEEAKQLAEVLIAEQPDRPEAYFALGYYYQYWPQDDPTTAITYYEQAIERRSGYTELYFHHARALRDTDGNTQRIIESLSTAITLDPDYNEYRSYRADFYMRQNMFVEAEADLWSILARDSNSLHHRNFLGYVLLRQDKRVDAFTIYFYPIEQIRTADVPFIARGAFVAWYGGNMEKASAWSQVALIIDPGNEMALYVCALMKADAGDFLGALADLELLEASETGDNIEDPYLRSEFGHSLAADRARWLAASGQLIPAIEAYKWAIDISPNWFKYNLLIERAAFLAANGLRDDARNDLTWALQIATDEGYSSTQEVLALLRALNAGQMAALAPTPTPTFSAVAALPPTPTAEPSAIAPPDPTLVALYAPSEQFESQRQSIELLIDNGRRDDAMRLVDSALAQDPESYELNALRAWVLASMNDDEKEMAGRVLAESLIASEPERGDAYFALGVYYVVSNYDLEKAVSLYDKAIELGYSNPRVFIERADRNQTRGAPLAVVLNDTNYLLQVLPDFSFAHMIAARAYMSDGNFAMAAASYQQAYELNQSASWLHSEIAYALIKNGQSGEAFEIYRKEIEDRQRIDGEYFADGAFIAYAHGETDRAMQWLENALALDPKAYKATYVKASLLSDTGDFEGALELLNSLEEVNNGEYQEPFLNANFNRHLATDRARLLRALERTDEAITMYQAAIEQTHWYWNTPRLELADVLIENNRAQEARPYLIDALRINAERGVGLEERNAILALLEKVNSKLQPSPTPTWKPTNAPYATAVPQQPGGGYSTQAPPNNSGGGDDGGGGDDDGGDDD